MTDSQLFHFVELRVEKITTRSGGVGKMERKSRRILHSLLQQVSFLYLKDVKARNEMMHFERGLSKKMHGPPGNALSEKKSPHPP